MKSIYIFIKQFFSSLRNNKSLYLIILVSLSITISSVIYFYCSAKAHDKDQMVHIEYRTVDVQMDKTPPLDDVLKLANDKDIKLSNVIFSGALKEAVFTDQIELPSKEGRGNEYSFFAELYPGDSKAFGNRIEQTHNDNAENVLVISSKFVLKNDNNILNLMGVDYNIIGTSDGGLSNDLKIQIPYTTLFANNFDVGKISFILDKDFTQSSLVALRDKIQDVGFDAKSIDLPTYDHDLQNRFRSDFFMTILIFILAIINFSYLYGYLLVKRLKTFSIYKITGLTKFSAFIKLQSEMIVLFSISFVAGVFVNYFVNLNLISMIFKITGLVVTIGDLLELFITMLILIVLCMSFPILKFINKSSIKGLKESEDQ